MFKMMFDTDGAELDYGNRARATANLLRRMADRIEQDEATDDFSVMSEMGSKIGTAEFSDSTVSEEIAAFKFDVVRVRTYLKENEENANVQFYVQEHPYMLRKALESVKGDMNELETLDEFREFEKILVGRVLSRMLRGTGLKSNEFGTF